MSKPDKILQWNVNGWRGKLTQIQSLLTNYSPEILALQETKLNYDSKISIKNFKIYRKDRDANGGGVALAITQNLPSRNLLIQTPLEAVAANVFIKILN